MRRRFSDQQLFDLRNHIPIDVVIEKLLRLPSKIIQGSLRFRCPLCAQFNTDIQPNTNQARCFCCEKKFNPIDIVMAVNHTDFIESVKLLIDYKANSFHDQNKISINAFVKKDSCLTPRKPAKVPIPIGQIVSELIVKDQTKNDEPDTTASLSQNSPLTKRVTKLEQDVRLLSHQINHLMSFMGNQK